MFEKKFGRKKKAANNEGRTTQVTSIMISKDLKDRLSEIKDAYVWCYLEHVTYDQMLARWADNIGNFDPEVLECLEKLRWERKKEQERLAAGLGLSPEQLKDNEAAFDPTAPENEPWKLKYFFEKDGEEVDAISYLDEPFFAGRLYYPFYAVIDGQNVGMAKLLSDGWTLQNEFGVELDLEQAQKIRALIKEHQE